MEVRYVLLSGHYRKPLNFTLDSLHAAQEALAKLAKVANGKTPPDYQELLRTSEFGVFSKGWKKLSEDLNTAGALGEIFANIKLANTDQDWQGFFAILGALGLDLPESKSVKAPAEIIELAQKRWEAKQSKDWTVSDQIRDELAVKGWTIKDSSDGYEVIPL